MLEAQIKEKVEHCLNCKNSLCSKGCPLENDISTFIHLVKEERYEEAYKTLSKTTVLESVCGRICPHMSQCMGKCIRGIKSTPVSIGEIEAFVGDMAIEKGWKIEENIQKNNKKIAVIGSGPSGLTCSAFLARKGYTVTLFEKYDSLGGILRRGIPDFRLDKNILDNTISKILELGIEVKLNSELGKDYTIEELQKQYDAVFISIGANISSRMNIDGENLKGVLGGNELLELGNHPDYTGKVVAVNGGGNVAMDCARTINKLGAKKVYVVYRRAEEQMPAEKEEIEAAKKEGVEFLFQNNIVKILSNSNGQADMIELIKTELVKKEGQDRLVPQNIEGSNYIIDIDYIVMAIGSKPNSELLNSLNIKLNKWGYTEVNEEYQTSLENVFAGGDLIGQKATVAWAAKAGRDAATSIDKYLNKE